MMETANGVAAATGVDFQKHFAKPDFNANASAWCMTPSYKVSGQCNSMELSGFRIEKINGVYTKDRSKLVQGRHVYINTNGLFFAYYCDELAEWRISVPEYVEKLQEGECRGWAAGVGLNFGDSSVSRGIREWYQTKDGQWVKAHAANWTCVNSDYTADLTEA